MGRGPTQPITFSNFHGPARPINFSKVSARPGPAYHIFKSLGPARPGPSPFSDRPGCLPSLLDLPRYKKKSIGEPVHGLCHPESSLCDTAVSDTTAAFAAPGICQAHIANLISRDVLYVPRPRRRMRTAVQQYESGFGVWFEPLYIAPTFWGRNICNLRRVMLAPSQSGL